MTRSKPASRGHAAGARCSRMAPPCAMGASGRPQRREAARRVAPVAAEPAHPRLARTARPARLAHQPSHVAQRHSAGRGDRLLEVRIDVREVAQVVVRDRPRLVVCAEHPCRLGGEVGLVGIGPPSMNPLVYVRTVAACSAITAVIAAESTPPLSITPIGRSLIICLTTARSNAARYASIKLDQSIRPSRWWILVTIQAYSGGESRTACAGEHFSTPANGCQRRGT